MTSIRSQLTKDIFPSRMKLLGCLLLCHVQIFLDKLLFYFGTLLYHMIFFVLLLKYPFTSLKWQMFVGCSSKTVADLLYSMPLHWANAFSVDYMPQQYWWTLNEVRAFYFLLLKPGLSMSKSHNPLILCEESDSTWASDQSVDVDGFL